MRVRRNLMLVVGAAIVVLVVCTIGTVLAQRNPPTFPGQPPVGAPPTAPTPSTGPVTQSANAPSYMRWDYRVRRYEVSKNRREDLNDLDWYGSDGWEVCGIRTYDYENNNGERTQVSEVIFKRPRP